jgi:hypothetical protein
MPLQNVEEKYNKYQTRCNSGVWVQPSLFVPLERVGNNEDVKRYIGERKEEEDDSIMLKRGRYVDTREKLVNVMNRRSDMTKKQENGWDWKGEKREENKERNGKREEKREIASIWLPKTLRNWLKRSSISLPRALTSGICDDAFPMHSEYPRESSAVFICLAITSPNFPVNDKRKSEHPIGVTKSDAADVTVWMNDPTEVAIDSPEPWDISAISSPSSLEREKEGGEGEGEGEGEEEGERAAAGFTLECVSLSDPYSQTVRMPTNTKKEAMLKRV